MISLGIKRRYTIIFDYKVYTTFQNLLIKINKRFDNLFTIYYMNY